MTLVWKLRRLTPLVAVAFMAAACFSSPAPATAPIESSTQSSDAAPAPVLNVVTTTNILGDWARQIGGDRAEVFSLMPIGADAHTFQPGARDVARIAGADLVLSVGLTLEGAWLTELIENAAADSSKVVALGGVADPIEFLGHGHEDEYEELEHLIHELEDGHLSSEEALERLEEIIGEHGEHHEDEAQHENGDQSENVAQNGNVAHIENEGHEDEEFLESLGAIVHGAEEGGITVAEAFERIEGLLEEHEVGEHEGEHEHGALDPHFWFDPLRAKLAVAEIASRLAALDSEGAETYLANSRAYQAKLDELHQWIEQQVSQIPEDRRLLATSHESFGYFARQYGFRTVGTVMPGVTTDREPSAQELAALVDELRAHGVPAIFTETSSSDRLAQRVAEEAGIQVVTGLHTESLGGPDSGADTYIRMMRKNVDIIVEALR